MDKEAIKKALDSFENDKFSDAKDILQKEIRTRRDEWLEEKLGLDEQSDESDDDMSDEEGDADTKKKKKKGEDDESDEDESDNES